MLVCARLLISPKYFAPFLEHLQKHKMEIDTQSYQGMTRPSTHASPWQEAHKQKVIDNALKVYHSLPEKLIFSTTNDSPIQIARSDDKFMFYLDIKFQNPGFQKELHNNLQKKMDFSSLLELALVSPARIYLLQITGKLFLVSALD